MHDRSLPRSALAIVSHGCRPPPAQVRVHRSESIPRVHLSESVSGALRHRPGVGLAPDVAAQPDQGLHGGDVALLRRPVDGHRHAPALPPRRPPASGSPPSLSRLPPCFLLHPPSRPAPLLPLLGCLALFGSRGDDRRALTRSRARHAARRDSAGPICAPAQAGFRPPSQRTRAPARTHARTQSLNHSLTHARAHARTGSERYRIYSLTT